MADYIFTQHGNNNVQIGDMTGMPYHVNTALKWALEHNFQSVAAQYSKTLALEVVRLREDNERLCAALQSSKKRAADYEQTGLTPDEIAALRDELAATQRITGEISDGYHTFNELYHHRATLFSVICNDRPGMAWKSRQHHDGTMYPGMFIVGIQTPDGQATYHYDVDPYWDVFDVPELEAAPEWDGHTPAQAIERISGLRSENEWEEAYSVQSDVNRRLDAENRRLRADLAAMTAERDAMRERAEAAEKQRDGVIDGYLEIGCDEGCSGDRSVGIPSCQFHRAPDIDGITGKGISGGCMLREWRGPVAQGGTDATQP